VLYSSLADDPEMGELVELFVDELPDRLESMRVALASADLDTLARCAHQLKGAAGSYGFDALTPALKDLEHAARQKGLQDELQRLLGEVTELCGRVRSGLPQS
jgi:HPt (histidine-containing phosphotransfer) domain-containing protein